MNKLLSALIAAIFAIVSVSAWAADDSKQDKAEGKTGVVDRAKAKIDKVEDKVEKKMDRKADKASDKKERKTSRTKRVKKKVDKMEDKVEKKMDRKEDTK